LRRLAIAKSIAIQAVKIHIENIKNEKLTGDQKDLPYFLALQAFWFNKIYHGNPDDPDIFAALSDLAELKYTIKGANGHSDAVRSICLSPDGKTIISSGDDGTVRLYSTASLAEKPVLLKTGNFGQKGFRCVTVDLTGKYIAAGAFDGAVLLWNSKNLTEKPIILTGHTGVVYKLVFDKESKQIYSVGSDGLVLVHNILSPSASVKIAQFPEKINALAVNASGTSLVCAGDNGILYFFDTEKYQKQKEIKCACGKIMTLLWSKSDEIVIGTATGKIEIRRAAKLEIVEKEVFAHSSGINDILYREAKNELISCSYDGTVKKWNTNNFGNEPIVLMSDDSWVFCLSYNSDYTKLYSGGADKTIQMMTVDQVLLKNEIRKKVQGQMPERLWKKYIGEDIEVMVNY
jgi:WD40 repeat protein